MVLAKTDEEIVTLICAGDIDLFEQIVLRYEKRVFNMALKITRNKQDAFDLTQEVFLKLYNNLTKFNELATFSTWFYRLTMNTIFDWTRKKGSEYEKINKLQQSFLTGEREVDLKNKQLLLERQIIIDELLTKIPVVYQQTIRFYYYDDKSYAQIAIIMGCSTKTVESRLSRAKKLLKNYLTVEEKEMFL